jgi:sensor histidine kinase YesM
MKARGLEVRVAGKVDGERLLLTVEDDGRGLPSDAPGSREAQREGVGLANTRARLRELYGERARLDLAARPEGGAVARVELPRRDNLEGRS